MMEHVIKTEIDKRVFLEKNAVFSRFNAVFSRFLKEKNVDNFKKF